MEKAPKPTSPGMVSIDMMASPIPGFIAQMIGKLLIAKYNYATAYIDQFKMYTCVHLQIIKLTAEKIEGKKAFEYISKYMGVKVQHYHADNGAFRANAWRDECSRLNQMTLVAEVEAHFQNGMAEHRIR